MNKKLISLNIFILFCIISIPLINSEALKINFRGGNDNDVLKLICLLILYFPRILGEYIVIYFLAFLFCLSFIYSIVKRDSMNGIFLLLSLLYFLCFNTIQNNLKSSFSSEFYKVWQNNSEIKITPEIHSLRKLDTAAIKTIDSLNYLYLRATKNKDELSNLKMNWERYRSDVNSVINYEYKNLNQKEFQILLTEFGLDSTDKCNLDLNNIHFAYWYLKNYLLYSINENSSVKKTKLKAIFLYFQTSNNCIIIGNKFLLFQINYFLVFLNMIVVFVLLTYKLVKSKLFHQSE